MICNLWAFQCTGLFATNNGCFSSTQFILNCFPVKSNRAVCEVSSKTGLSIFCSIAQGQSPKKFCARTKYREQRSKREGGVTLNRIQILNRDSVSPSHHVAQVLVQHGLGHDDRTLLGNVRHLAFGRKDLIIDGGGKLTDVEHKRVLSGFTSVCCLRKQLFRPGK